MANRNSINRNVRNVQQIGSTSLGVTLPIEILRQLGWKKRHKVVVKKIRGGVAIKDWKK